MKLQVGDSVARFMLLYAGMKLMHDKCGTSPYRRKIWLVRCRCLTIKEVLEYHLKSGATPSCGCLKKENNQNRRKPDIHDPDHPEKKYRDEYNIWLGMRARCRNQNRPDYERYAGRGISVCDEWECSFESFFAYVGVRPGPKYSLERINNNGNYEPGNVIWATAKVQGRNTRKNILIPMNGKTFTLAEWSEITGINALTIRYRIDHGWTVERALTERPPRNRTGFKGVHRTPYNRFHVMFSGKYLGSFDTAADASAAYESAKMTACIIKNEHKRHCVGKG